MDAVDVTSETRRLQIVRAGGGESWTTSRSALVIRHQQHSTRGKRRMPAMTALPVTFTTKLGAGSVSSV
jgi:hypothetical protein